jgi:hypothetical protein
MSITTCIFFSSKYGAPRKEMYRREYSLVSKTQRREDAPSARPTTSMQIIVAIKKRSPAPRIAQYKFKRLKK